MRTLKHRLYKSFNTPTPSFLRWIAARLVNKYGEDPNIDFVLSLKERATLIEEHSDELEQSVQNCIADADMKLREALVWAGAFPGGPAQLEHSVSGAVEELKKAREFRREIAEVLNSIPGAVAVREGGGRKNLAASLALSIEKLKNKRST